MFYSTKIQLFPENCIVRLSFKSENDNLRLQNGTLMKEILGVGLTKWGCDGIYRREGAAKDRPKHR